MMPRLLVLLVSLLLAIAAWSQDDLNISSLAPPTYKLEDLPKNMVPLELGQIGNRGNGGLLEDMMGMFTSLFAGSLSVNDDAEGAFLGLVNLYFTTGKQVDLLDSKFMVTYKIGLDLAGKPGDGSAGMPEVKSAYWRVVYVRVSEVKTIAPATNWTLEKAIATVHKIIEKSKAEAAKREAEKKQGDKPTENPTSIPPKS